MVGIQSQKHGEDSEIILDLLPWLLIGGIIGARLWHVLPFCFQHRSRVTTENYLRIQSRSQMWKGGLGIPGGLVARWLDHYTKAKLSFWQWADFIAPVC